MSTPIDIAAIVPSKAKAWVGLIGSVLTFAGPFILDNAHILPSPWPVVIGLFFALATALGIYRAPYKPTGTELVPKGIPGPTGTVLSGNVFETTEPDTGQYRNPWRQ